MSGGGVTRMVPARRAVAVDISGGDHVFPEQDTPRAIYVGSGGDIAVDMKDNGTNIVFVGVVTGSILPIEVSRIRQTGTTATDLVALQ